MLRFLLSCSALVLLSGVALAQQPRTIDDVVIDQVIMDDSIPAGQQQQTTQIVTEIDATTPPATPENIADNVTPTYEQKKFAVLQTLDKLTARTRTITLPIGTPASVGPLFIDVKTCQKTPPTEKPESATFIQVWETKRKSRSKAEQQAEKSKTSGSSQWVFSGWMFASSPALSAINHPIYDVWLKDCVDSATPAAK